MGDNHNDLSLFAQALVAAAPANAVSAVLEAADVILRANHDDGVAGLLEELAPTEPGGFAS